MTKKVGTALGDSLLGSAQSDQLYGLAGRDRLIGLAGNDLLDGGKGDDDLRGGAGNDTYIVDNINDITRSVKDPGIDLVKSSVSYTLGLQQENLTLTGKANLHGTGNSGANVLIGNLGNNLLIGGDGDDHLDGVRGHDSLRGGNGNDSYTVHSVTDINQALPDPGFDQVMSSVSYVLGSQQEDLLLLGKLALSATGNDDNNRVFGNIAANVLNGAGGDDLLHGGNGNDILSGNAGNDVLFGDNGDDVLLGGAGNDYLDGGAGNDRYEGGAGNDQYLLEKAGELDKTIIDPGIDKVGVAFDYHLGDQQEDLFLLGAAGLHGIGNDHDNQLFGTSGNDILEGRGGDDYLDGGEGQDSLRGDAGNDVYILRADGEIDRNVSDPGIDEVRSALSYTLGPQQENLVLSGSVLAIDGNGNVADNVLVGNEAANILHGGAGDDELRGGGGADQLFGDDGADILHFLPDAVRIDGGADVDTLQVGGDGVNLDLTSIADNVITGIETIAMTSSSNNSLNFTLSDLLALSDTTDTLNVLGHAGDVVTSTGQGWVADAGPPVLNAGHLYHAYSLGSAHLLVETEITQTVN